MAWEHYRIGELCRQYPLMDDIIGQRDLGRVLDFLTVMLNSRVTIDNELSWTISVDTVWLSPDWGWFESDIGGIFDTVLGFSITDDENIGLRHASFSASGTDPFDAALVLIADVTRWRRGCIEACDAWVLDHVAEIDMRASDAVAHNRVTIDALDELREWIQVLQWSAGWERPWV
ncbi:MAG: hypothetical protein ACP5HZ_12945 [Ferrimicrobium sp.]